MSISLIRRQQKRSNFPKICISLKSNCLPLGERSSFRFVRRYYLPCCSIEIWCKSSGKRYYETEDGEVRDLNKDDRSPAGVSYLDGVDQCWKCINDALCRPRVEWIDCRIVVQIIIFLMRRICGFNVKLLPSS